MPNSPRGQDPIHAHHALSTTPSKSLEKQLQWDYNAMARWNTTPAKDKAMQAIIDALDSTNPRIQMMAVRNLLVMEKQNQIDEIEARRPKVLTRLNLNATISEPQAIEAKRQLGLENQNQLSLEQAQSAVAKANHTEHQEKSGNNTPAEDIAPAKKADPP